jgi:ABC-2 type transport system ATP-binding protein
MNGTPPPVVALRGVSRSYRGTRALDDVDLDLAADRIYGLVGRNGSGKTTLLSVIGQQVRPDPGGRVELFGRPAWENAEALSRTVLLRDRQRYPEEFRVRHVLAAAPAFSAGWDPELARRLAEDFRLPARTKVKRLSTGQHSALGIVLGLASRAELTMLDEPYGGLDPVARELFYDRLLEDFARHPRTVVISTHLVDEVANLLDHVLLLDRGRLVLDADLETARASAHTVAGRADDVGRYLADRGLTGKASREQRIGALRTVTVAAPHDDDARDAAARHGLEIDAVSLQAAVAAHGLVPAPADQLQTA